MAKTLPIIYVTNLLLLVLFSTAIIYYNVPSNALHFTLVMGYAIILAILFFSRSNRKVIIGNAILMSFFTIHLLTIYSQQTLFVLPLLALSLFSFVISLRELIQKKSLPALKTYSRKQKQTEAELTSSKKVLKKIVKKNIAKK